MRIFIALIIFLGSFGSVFSQELKKETRDGKLFVVHAVEAGNTLYGLHVKYAVSIEDIIKENPTAKDGLQIGQILYIPTNEDAVKSNPVDEFVVHVVKRKETLYGISREYGVTVADIIEYNPDAEQGLDIKQELKIPVVSNKQENQKLVDQSNQAETSKEEISKDENEFKAHNPFKNDSVTVVDYKVDFKDSIVNYEVQKGETLYSISRRFMVPVETLVEQNNLEGSAIKPGQMLKIRLKKERIEEVEVRELAESNISKRSNDKLVKVKDKYKVLVVLPMKINENSEVLSGVYTEKTTLSSLTKLSVDFLMGAQMALDSLEKLGLNADVEFYDSEGRLNKLKEKLDSKNGNNIDLVIGPLYPNLFEYAADWGKTNQVPVIAVTKIPTQILEQNPYVFSMVPSDLTLMSGMARYLAKHHSSDNIVLIKGENAQVNERVSYFVDVYNRNIVGDSARSIRLTDLGTASGRSLMNAIQPDERNFIICLSEEVQQVMKFVNTLNEAKNYSPTYGKADVTMVGLQSWLDISALNSYYKNRFEFHYAGTNHLDYEDINVKNFIIDFRAEYGSDPSKYAFHGFDVVLSQCASLLLGYDRDNGLMDYFSVSPLGMNHGRENSSVFISKQKDFEILMLGIISNHNQFNVQQRGGN
ncbi:amino acid ABC transporter substrate-binding protein [Brumimicrobium aurantiacum]|nr:LysM peptidoglycan-binding domain-containing protein [Brumimicrobium aurantiacum]